MSSSTTTATSSSVNDSNDNITPPNPPTAHNQFIADPLAHFNAIPWCAAQLQDPANLNVSPSDRRPLPNGEASFVRKTMNSATTVRACVTYYRAVKPSPLPPPPSTSSSSTSTVTSMPASKTTTTTTTTTTATEKTKNNDNSNNDNNPPISASTALLSGGGKACGEDPRNPFLLFNALVDLGPDCTSYVGTMHGGLFGVLMDEVMGTAANLQSSHGTYTVRFTTSFLRAVKTPQIVVVRGRVVRKDGRKIYVRGTVEDRHGKLMAEGDGIWLRMNRNIGHSQL